MREELFYTQHIRGQDGNHACSVNYKFKAHPGRNWDILNVDVVDPNGAILAEDSFFSRDYRGHEAYRGKNSPTWLVSPSSSYIDIIAKAATPEGHVEEAPQNRVALALCTSINRAPKRLCLTLNDKGYLSLLMGDITQADLDAAVGLAEREEEYGLDIYKTTCRNAIRRTLNGWLNVPDTPFGTQLAGIWYNPDAGNFTHVYDVASTLDNIFVGKHLKSFDKNTVSVQLITEVRELLHRVVADLLLRNSYDHDTVFKLRRNGMLDDTTVAIIDRVPSILPPPPGFSV